MARTTHNLLTAFRAPRLRVATLMAAVLLLMTAPSGAAPVDFIGTPAPDFALRSANGPNLRLSEFRTDVVVLNFRADWCGQCSRTVAALAELQTQHAAAGLQVLTVDVDGHAGHAVDDLPLLLDEQQAVSRLYDIKRLPVTVLIDRDGRVRHVYDKANDNAAALAANVAVLLAE